MRVLRLMSWSALSLLGSPSLRPVSGSPANWNCAARCSSSSDPRENPRVDPGHARAGHAPLVLGVEQPSHGPFVIANYIYRLNNRNGLSVATPAPTHFPVVLPEIGELGSLRLQLVPARDPDGGFRPLLDWLVTTEFVVDWPTVQSTFEWGHHGRSIFSLQLTAHLRVGTERQDDLVELIGVPVTQTSPAATRYAYNAIGLEDPYGRGERPVSRPATYRLSSISEHGGHMRFWIEGLYRTEG